MFLLNGTLNIYESRVYLPRNGAWTGDLWTDPPANGQPMTGLVTVALGNLTLSGFVVQSGIARSAQWLRLVGGAGGLSSKVTPKSYEQVTVNQLVSDALASVGERLDPTDADPVLTTVLPAWTRPTMTCGAQLDVIAAKTNANWRVQPDGTTWFGTDLYPNIDGSQEHLTQMKDQPQRPATIFGCDLPFLLPATTLTNVPVDPENNLNGQRIESVEHIQAPDGIRSIVRWSQGQVGFAGFLQRIVRKDLSEISLYLGQYPSTVITFNANGTVDLVTDSNLIGELQNVPLDPGLPGFAATSLTPGSPASGQRVALYYEGGDPTLKRARFLAGTTNPPPTVSFAGGTLPVMRNTDPVIATPEMVTWMSQVAGYINGLVPGTVTPPAPATFGTNSGGNPNLLA